jgi:hypothetical protein
MRQQRKLPCWQRLERVLERVLERALELEQRLALALVQEVGPQSRRRNLGPQ